MTLGWRNTDRLPTLFLDAVKGVKSGEIAPFVRSPNGFHILKVLGRRSAVAAKLAGGPVQQTHARHILLRVSDVSPEQEVRRRLEEFKAAHRSETDRIRHAGATAFARPERKPWR